MNSFKIDKKSFSFKWNSWLWWAAADIDGSPHWPYPKDFCTYWRHTLIYSTIVLIFYLMMIITVVFLIFGFGLALFTKPFVVLTGVATITAIITIIFIIANKSDWLMEYIFSPIGRTVWRFGLGQIMRSIGTILKWVFVCVMDICLAILPKKPESTKTNTLNKPRQPGFLMQKYLAIKENYCPMIEYTEQ